jgi:hypothetical protein
MKKWPYRPEIPIQERGRLGRPHATVTLSLALPECRCTWSMNEARHRYPRQAWRTPLRQQRAAPRGHSRSLAREYVALMADLNETDGGIKREGAVLSRKTGTLARCTASCVTEGRHQHEREHKQQRVDPHFSPPRRAAIASDFQEFI